jgi:hypothetical protein
MGLAEILIVYISPCLYRKIRERQWSPDAKWIHIGTLGIQMLRVPSTIHADNGRGLETELKQGAGRHGLRSDRPPASQGSSDVSIYRQREILVDFRKFRKAVDIGGGTDVFFISVALHEGLH